MAAILEAGETVTGWVAQRPEGENPRDPRCKLHLQRICGTCEHFQGALRRGDPQATCGAFQVVSHRQASAANCRRWWRKGGGNV